MAGINILDPHVADLIAAGEVVERPASVLKELLENSFDAGAKNVVIEIHDGGTTYLRVTDDGCGMSPEDAGIAFLRHATSKLADAAGLEHIGTMGFRGEALAAISSVTHMEIITRQHGADEGTRVVLEAGEIADMGAYGCPEGTTMICRDLFYNTPARLKFLKSDRAEASACIGAAQRCALGRSDVSVRLIRDGEEEFFTPGDGRLESALYAVLGREETVKMLPLTSSLDRLAVSGFISSPAEGRGNRARQFFYVNGRCIKSQLLQTALEQAYRNTLLTGKYPSCALLLKMPLGMVDVNVHPAKTEVRFVNEKETFDFVYQAVKLALESEDRLAAPDLPAAAPYAPVSYAAAPRPSTPLPRREENAFRAPAAAYAAPPVGRSEIIPEFAASRQSDQSAKKSTNLAASGSRVANFVENSVQNVESSATDNYKILGQAFRTYIIVEQNGEIVLIDKHAAHERMIFDRLKTETREIPSQLLISPVTVRLSPGDAELIEQNGELLGELGFEIEPYGRSEYAIRGIPRDMAPSEAAAAIEDICERLGGKNAPDPAAARDAVLHTVACKAAIKAGWDTDERELRVLAEKVLSGEIRYCPHGRPVSVTVTRAELDKLFKRIV